MKAQFRAIFAMGLLLAGPAARATLEELGAVEPVAAPAVSFQLSAASVRLLGFSEEGMHAVDWGFVSVDFLKADAVFITQPLIATMARDQSGLLFSTRPLGLATRFYCASMDTRFPYVDPRFWTAGSSPAWMLAFSYDSLTSHTESLLHLTPLRKNVFLSPSLFQAAPDYGAPNVDDQ